MNHKLKGRSLIHGEINSPEITLAEFSKELTKDAIQRMVSSMNYGHKILMIYKQHRDNMHITNVVDMLKKIEEEFRKFEDEVYTARRMK